MKNLSSYLNPPPPKAGFDQMQMEHRANNPVQQARVEKAFQLKAPKMKMDHPKMDKGPGSPWLTMGESK